MMDELSQKTLLENLHDSFDQNRIRLNDMEITGELSPYKYKKWKRELCDAEEQIRKLIQRQKVCRSEMQDFFSGNYWDELNEKEKEELNTLIDKCSQFLKDIGLAFMEEE
jgi:hypothetical protein